MNFKQEREKFFTAFDRTFLITRTNGHKVRQNSDFRPPSELRPHHIKVATKALPQKRLYGTTPATCLDNVCKSLVYFLLTLLPYALLEVCDFKRLFKVTFDQQVMWMITMLPELSHWVLVLFSLLLSSDLWVPWSKY